MGADLVARLRRCMQGKPLSEIGVAGVAHVAAAPATCAKQLKLQQLRLENDKIANDETSGVAGGVAALLDCVAVDVDYRAGMAAEGVPEAYLVGWAHLQCLRPASASEEEWRQAIIDAGLFLDRWGNLAVALGWTPSDLFDVPSDGSPGGLVWRINGQGIRALGDGHAVTNDGRGV